MTGPGLSDDVRCRPTVEERARRGGLCGDSGARTADQGSGARRAAAGRDRGRAGPPPRAGGRGLRPGGRRHRRPGLPHHGAPDRRQRGARARRAIAAGRRGRRRLSARRADRRDRGAQWLVGGALGGADHRGRVQPAAGRSRRGERGRCPGSRGRGSIGDLGGTRDGRRALAGPADRPGAAATGVRGERLRRRAGRSSRVRRGADPRGAGGHRRDLLRRAGAGGEQRDGRRRGRAAGAGGASAVL